MTPATLLHRQVHPSFVQQGRVSSQAFRPTPKDEKKLSVYDVDRITAARAVEHYTGTLRFASAGVLAVSEGECRAMDLAAIPDPAPFPEHILIDFTPFSENEIKRRAKKLNAFAEARGWQYQASSGS